MPPHSTVDFIANPQLIIADEVLIKLDVTLNKVFQYLQADVWALITNIL